jgi:hypothetical protein
MAELLPIKYPADGGYTPGDTWDLYVGKDNRVVYFVYHRGGAKPPSRVLATWTGYKKAGPILFSTEHRGFADGKSLHIFISDVAGQADGLGQVDERAINVRGGARPLRFPLKEIVTTVIPSEVCSDAQRTRKRSRGTCCSAGR